MSPAGLLSLVLLAPGDVGPKLQAGDELAYAGTVAEAVDRPGNRFRRRHDLEVRVFVLERRESWADAAILTLLRRAEDVVTGAVAPVTGGTPDRAATPPAARLDLVRIHADGTVHQLLPFGPPPLKLAADTPARAPPAVPLDSFAPFEFGMFPPRPPRGHPPDQPWNVASTDLSRPAESWRVRGFEFITAERCAELAMTQQTADWAKPSGNRSAWQRVDAVWVSTADGTARRVHRVVARREGLSDEPLAVVETKYELKGQTRLIGRTFDHYRREIEVGYAAAAEAAPLLPDAVKLGPKPFEARLARLDAHLRGDDQGTPYREALLAVRRQLDAARKGEASPAGGRDGGSFGPPTSLQPPPPLPAATPKVPEVGQPAPDCDCGGSALSALRGRPVVLVFFRPGAETTDMTLAVADALPRKYGDRLAVVPLTVFGDRAAGEKDRDRLKFTIPVHDGSAAAAAFGVETFPRFVVLDSGGAVRWVFRGVGAETGYLVCREVEKLLAAPAGPAAPAGTIGPAGPPTPGSPPRP